MTLPSAGFTPDPQGLPIIRQLFLLGFKPLDMLDSLERGVGRSFTISEVEDHIAHLHELWGVTPEAHGVRVEEAKLWALSDQFQDDMLGLYTDVLANARATLAGEFNHAGTGRPVIKTKPAEVVALAKEIRAMARLSIEEKRAAGIQVQAKAPQAAPQSEPVKFDPFSDEDDDDLIGGYTPPERTEL